MLDPPCTGGASTAARRLAPRPRKSRPSPGSAPSGSAPVRPKLQAQAKSTRSAQLGSKLP
eukprot:3753732-Pyramimonas_sp.AAC.1